MKILQNTSNGNLPLNINTHFGTELGWEEAMQDFEKQTLESIINPSCKFLKQLDICTADVLAEMIFGFISIS